MLLNEAREWLHDLRQMRTRGSFARNAMFAFSGTAVVVLSQLLLTPFIARIYAPEVYGFYGIFLSICTNLAVVADMGYTHAYVLPREQEKFTDLVRGNLVILMIVLVAMLPLVLARDLVFTWLPGWSGIGWWWYALPLGVVVQFVPIMLTQWLMREKAFGRSSSLGGGSNLLLRLFNLGYGWMTRGAAHGLILGELLVRGLSIGAYWYALRPYGIKQLFDKFNWTRIRAVMYEYRDQPQFIFPSRYVGMLGLQLPIFMLSSDPAAVGYFSMASSLLLIPLRLFGFSVGTVFQQKAAETMQRDPADMARVTGRFFDRLLITGVLPFAFIIVFGDLVFGLFLGKEWTMSGVYAAFLGLFFFFRHLSEPIAPLINVHRKAAQLLWFQAILMMIRLAVLAAGILWLGSATKAVLAYGIVSALGYAAFSAHLLRLAGMRWLAPMTRSVLLLAGAVLLLALLRQLIFNSWTPFS